MRVQVKLYAALRQYQPQLQPGQALALDVPPGTTVGQVIRQVGIPDNVPLVAMVNTSVRKLEHVLGEEDKLSLFPPVAGG
jgi:molybdopterin synthase sulfur carrier subunit